MFRILFVEEWLSRKLRIQLVVHCLRWVNNGRDRMEVKLENYWIYNKRGVRSGQRVLKPAGLFSRAGRAFVITD
jgi:hypothetical protein